MHQTLFKLVERKKKFLLEYEGANIDTDHLYCLWALETHFRINTFSIKVKRTLIHSMTFDH